jgi:hypothetical protein
MRINDPVAGGAFTILIIDLQIIRASFCAERIRFKESSLPEFKRPEDIMNIFFSNKIKERKVGDGPYFLEKNYEVAHKAVVNFFC